MRFQNSSRRCSGAEGTQGTAVWGPAGWGRAPQSRMRSLGAGGGAGVRGLGKRNGSKVNQQDGLVEHQGRELCYCSAFRHRCCGSVTPRRHLWMQ